MDALACGTMSLSNSAADAGLRPVDTLACGTMSIQFKVRRGSLICGRDGVGRNS